ncbi:hypothetical protein SDC9_158881 [bioreactor metagenome]|uniref:Uncharacterized protein n=1 Tax=bioreactor metagenome TaxID=1076179 RepID=A0A645FB35_9ZZZZ
MAQASAHERVVHQQQAFLQRHADVIDELHRRGARAAFGTVHHDEVGRDVGLQHGLDDGEPLPRMAHAELEAGGLAAGFLAQPGDELHHLDRCLERAVRGGADAVHTHGHAARGGDLGRDLGAQQHAAMARLGALAELQLNHLDLRIGGIGDELFFAERAVVVAAAEVARCHFPDQIAAMHAVVLAD